MLKVEGLKKYFGGVRAVDGVSFGIREREVVSLVGPNGAGKTTLIDLISGAIKPDSGRIEFCGKDLTKIALHQRAKQGIIRCFQLTNLFEGISVKDHVKLALLAKSRRRWDLISPLDSFTDLSEETSEILSEFGIEIWKDFLPGELSQGNRKRLDIALTFACKPRILLLDEPTTSVAAESKHRIMDIILSMIKHHGASALIVEHDLEIAANYTERTLLMSQGRIVADGKPEEVIQELKALPLG